MFVDAFLDGSRALDPCCEALREHACVVASCSVSGALVQSWKCNDQPRVRALDPSI